MSQPQIDRRRFLNRSLIAAGALTAASAKGYGLHLAQARRPFGEVVVQTPFARVEKLAEGVWAVVSTPFKLEGGFGDMTTVCNGGLIAGSEGVLVIDTFQRPAGAAWVADQALKLTGKRPTHVLITHFHADHSGGAAGFQNGADGPAIMATETTRRLIWERYQNPIRREGEATSRVRLRFLAPTRVIPDDSGPFDLDLGGRSVRIEPHRGHTPSDVTATVDDPRIVFDGDLVWKDVFPNYSDSIPSDWSKNCRKLLSDGQTIHVTGHGDVARASALRPYEQLLNEVEKAARAAHAAGKDAAAAAKDFRLPESFERWVLPNPASHEWAFRAWYRELG